MRPVQGRRPFVGGVLIAGLAVLSATGCAPRDAGWRTSEAAAAGHLAAARASLRGGREPERQLTGPPNPGPAHPVPEFAPAGLLVFVYSDIVPVLELVRAAVPATRILILARSESHRQEANRVLREGGFGEHLADSRIQLRRQELDSVWIRDYAPLFVRDRSDRVIALDTIYAARAVKPDQRPLDDLAGSLLGRSLQVPTLRPPFVIAGGNFAADGAGRCFTSTKTIGDNGGNRSRVDALMGLYLGCDRVLYLEPLAGPTTKHIDMFFRVARPGVYLLAEYAAPPGRGDASGTLQARARDIMERNAAVLRRAAAREGERVEIIRVPAPPITPLEAAAVEGEAADATTEPRRAAEGSDPRRASKRDSSNQRFVYRSFLNYVHLPTHLDDLLLVPSFPDAVDAGDAEGRATGALQRAYPGSRIVPIEAESLIAKQGALHCATWVVPDSVDLGPLLEAPEATAAGATAAEAAN